jgi:thiamine biosynthesis lipoprotein
MRRRVPFIAAGSIIALGAILWAMRAAPDERGTAQLVGATMGGDWSVRFRTPLSGRSAQRLQREIQEILDAVDRQMSTWKPDSDVSRFNRSASTDWQAVPRELAAVVSEARRISEQTGGAFDVTVAPLVNLWGFGPTTSPTIGPRDSLPSDDAIAQAKARVGYTKLDVRFDPPALRKRDAALTIDLSAIAQGYAADCVSDALAAGGFAEHLVNVCGEIRARGRGPHAGPWRVGIQAPVPDTIRTFEGVTLNDVALAASGDYKNYFEHAGRTYSHEIDPRSGRPVTHNLAAVSVVHASAARADALATGLLVLGFDEGWAVAERDGLEALFITRTSSGLESHPTTNFRRLQLPHSEQRRGSAGWPGESGRHDEKSDGAIAPPVASHTRTPRK